VEFYRFTGSFRRFWLPFFRRLVAVRSYGSGGGDVFFSESVRRLRPVAIFREFIGGTNAHLNRDLQHILHGGPHALVTRTCNWQGAISKGIFD